MIYNVYCDESCHLEHDGIPVMVLGSIWLPKASSSSISRDLNDLKLKHGLSASFECKWTKVSPAKLSYFKDVIDYFWDNKDIRFRGVIIPDKSLLKHSVFKQNHDDFYYKMYYVMLKHFIEDDNAHCIYLDIKDTRGNSKVLRLAEVLRNKFNDSSGHTIAKVQQVRSHEVEALQLADLIIGAIAYEGRRLMSSPAKLYLVRLLEEGIHRQLSSGTRFSERKLNILHWHAAEGGA